MIPAGSFMMGSPVAEIGHRDNEPQSMVTIAHAFAVSRTEVTWDQWDACVRGRMRRNRRRKRAAPQE